MVSKNSSPVVIIVKFADKLQCFTQNVIDNSPGTLKTSSGTGDINEISFKFMCRPIIGVTVLLFCFKNLIK